jgi:hypothetical protein
MTKPFTLPQKLTPAQFTALKGKLSEDKATTVMGNDSNLSISGHGINATAIFDAQTGELSVTVINKPWLLSVNEIQTKLEQEVQEIFGATATGATAIKPT